MAAVDLQNVTKRFGETLVIDNVSLSIEDKEFLVLVGPSGCGKSTLLRMIAGLETVSEGSVSIGGRVVNNVPPKDRNIAMVFQNYALYPHMNVYQNMSFGLRMMGRSRDEIDERVREAARILELSHLLDRRPAQLSGGQRQRVAMGRAIVRKPQVFLFDEPLSNLDAKLRVQMRQEIKKLHERLAATIVYVTHDQVEAMTLATRVAVIDKGVIQQAAPPAETYEHPANLFVAGFIGSPGMNFVPARLTRGEGGWALDAESMRLPFTGDAGLDAAEDHEITMGIRPEHVAASPDGLRKPHAARLDVDLVEPMGATQLVTGRVGDHMLSFVVPTGRSVPVHGVVEVFLDTAQIKLFDAHSGVGLFV